MKDKQEPITSISEFPGNDRILNFIQSHDQNRNEDLSILDFGCGRGKAVIWLRKQGYKAKGVDISSDYIAHGQKYLRETGGEPSCLVSLEDPGSLPFESGKFDLIFSNQVFEHVKDPDTILPELARVSKHGGNHFHLLPAREQFFEPHLLMPIVHWLPKNPVRKPFIAICTLMGLEPNWDQSDSMGEKISAYYKYGITDVFYRSRTFYRKLFTNFFESVSISPIRNYSKKSLFGLFPAFYSIKATK
ncbi:MAG: class I SAM-dependent methyltransferase [bacterium]